MSILVAIIYIIFIMAKEKTFKQEVELFLEVIMKKES